MVKVVLIPGDGIGPEITEATLKVLRNVVDVDFIRIEAGLKVWREKGYPISREDLEEIKRIKFVLKGPIATPTGGGYRSVNVLLRKELDLYANLRIFKSNPKISPFKNVNIVLVRENIEGLYSGIDFKISTDIALSLRVVTRRASKRIVEFAFKYAAENHRGKVTLVHKANILKETCGLFLEVGREVSKSYPDITFEEAIVDAAAYRLVRNPESFDVIVTTNMFGDILSDEIAGFIGSIGLIPSANLGEKYALFEAIHGTAPDIAGRGIANPTGLMLSSALMLRYLNMQSEAERIERAVEKTLEYCRTIDLGGKASTMEFTDEVLRNLSS